MVTRYVTVDGSHGRCFEIRPPEFYKPLFTQRPAPLVPGQSSCRSFSGSAVPRPQLRHVHPSVGCVRDGARALRRAAGPASRPGGQHGLALPDRAGDGPGHRVPHHGDLPAPEKHAGGSEGGRRPWAWVEKAGAEGSRFRSSVAFGRQRGCHRQSLSIGSPYLRSEVFLSDVSVPRSLPRKRDVFQNGFWTMEATRPRFEQGL